MNRMWCDNRYKTRTVTEKILRKSQKKTEDWCFINRKIHPDSNKTILRASASKSFLFNKAIIYDDYMDDWQWKESFCWTDPGDGKSFQRTIKLPTAAFIVWQIGIWFFYPYPKLRNTRIQIQTLGKPEDPDPNHWKTLRSKTLENMKIRIQTFRKHWGSEPVENMRIQIRPCGKFRIRIRPLRENDCPYPTFGKYQNPHPTFVKTKSVDKFFFDSKEWMIRAYWVGNYFILY